MKNKVLLMSAVLLLLGVGTSKSFGQFPSATDPSLQELAFDTPGTGSIDTASLVTGPTFFTAEAVMANGFDLSAFDTGSGLGTIVYTVTNSTNASVNSFFDVFFDEEVGTVFDNEFGAANNFGSLPAGETWEIGDSFNSTIFDDESANLLLDTNFLPSGATNLPPPAGLGCTPNFTAVPLGGGCNGDAATALGYGFAIDPNSEEFLTVTVSTTVPGGFYLSQTNPDFDGSGTPETVYFTLSGSESPVGTGCQINCGPPPCTDNCGPPPCTDNCGTPGVTPEPSSWLLVASGLGAGIAGMRRRFSFKAGRKALSVVALFMVALIAAPFANAQAVVTVPWVPTNPAAPHTAYSGASIVLGAVFTGAVSGHSYNFVWNFGDGTPIGAAAAVTNPNDISARHTYAGTTTGQTFTAQVTVTDTTNSAQFTGNYLVIWEPNNLSSRVNVAIDLGLWYLHQDMYHPTATTGNWDQSCASGYSGFACANGQGSLTATNLQAFEVNGHLPTGPASDPYTSDAAEAMASLFSHLTSENVVSKSYTYNPAVTNYGCSDGTPPTTSNTCAGTATKVFYDAAATSCTSPPCVFSFDGNSNGKTIFSSPGAWGYEPGMYIDALVASTTPNATAPGTAPVGIANMSYKDIVQDMIDATNYCEYGGDVDDVSSGVPRGEYPYQGGGWWYSCIEGGDNSVSQWAAIGLIAGQRGFGISIPSIVTDANNMWVTASQDVQSAKPTGTDPWNDGTNYSVASGMDYGAFGYNGSIYYSNAWGTFATTPSGMVQMSMDGIGRTHNTAFGDASNDPDQRFNNAETFYADNFCNVTGPSDGGQNAANDAPRAYTYGMFSFTKAMLLHNPGGTLTPIQYLRTQTPGVFPGGNGTPVNSIDWYSAVASTHLGGTDPCDGVAQTLINDQNTAGYWYGDNFNGGQYPYETAWALIMLQRTVFVNCVNNLGGVGTANSGINPARIDLSWTGIPNVTGYNVLRSSTTGGPYTQIGTTVTTVYSDRVGLSNGSTYYYVLQPVNGSGAVCQSNQATTTVPMPRTR